MNMRLIFYYYVHIYIYIYEYYIYNGYEVDFLLLCYIIDIRLTMK